MVFSLGRVARGPAGRGQPRGILHIFRLAELLMERAHVLYPLTPEGWLRYEIARLPVRGLPLPGAPTVRRGDPIVVIHFDNRLVGVMAAEATSRHQLTWRLARAADADMQALADLVRAGTFPPTVRAVWVEGLFAPALRRYGFTTRAVTRRWRAPWARLFLLALVAIYGPDGLDRLGDERLLRLPITEAWIGLDELQRRLPAHAADASDARTDARRTSLQGRAPGVPGSGGLVGVPDAQHRGLVEGPADQLETDG
jgi:hypothetical protein